MIIQTLVQRKQAVIILTFVSEMHLNESEMYRKWAQDTFLMRDIGLTLLSMCFQVSRKK